MNQAIKKPYFTYFLYENKINKLNPFKNFNDANKTKFDSTLGKTFIFISFYFVLFNNISMYFKKFKFTSLNLNLLDLSSLIVCCKSHDYFKSIEGLYVVSIA